MFVAPVLQLVLVLEAPHSDTTPFLLLWEFLRCMESNITDQQFWSPDTPLAEPHFDEEVTLLSARPVVPIDQLNRKPVSSTRPWVFGLALAGAILLGVSATALYYSKFRTIGPQAEPNIDKFSSGVQGAATDAVTRDKPAIDPRETTATTGAGNSSVDSNTPTPAQFQAPSVSWTSRPPNSSNATSKKLAHLHPTVVIDPGSEPEYEIHKRGWAKREAKERKRENRGGRDRKSSDELLRIREIFEGLQRP